MTPNEQELIKQAKRAYKKEWRAKNKDKIKAANDRFYLKFAKKLAAEQAKENTAE